MKMKKNDMKILVEMRKNSRSQLTEISKKTSIPISTIYDKLKNNSNGVITKNVSIINFERIGFNTIATICLKCGKTSKKEVYELLENHYNINSLYKINNGFDYMFEAVFKNVKNLEEFIEMLEDKYSIKSKLVFYIIDTIKKEEFFTNETYLNTI
jgi:DNA-binding Lrp family transcriptional regulator